MNFFEKAINALKHNKDTQVIKDTTPTHASNIPTEQERPDIVTKYILVNPQSLLTNYELFSLCKTIPVAIESEKTSPTGFCNTIPLQTTDFLPHLKELKNAPTEVAANPENRTLYEIKLNNGEKMYIYPSFKHPKNPWISFEKNVAFNVTPEINRVIVNILKKYTR